MLPSPSDPVTRRDFLRTAAIAAAASQMPAALRGAAAPAAGTATPPNPLTDPAKGVELHWLDGAEPAVKPGTTLGVPWARGKVPANATFAALTVEGRQPVPVQSWPIAYWPDGSLKWTGHAFPADTGGNGRILLGPGQPAAPATPLTVRDAGAAVEIDTGVIRVRIPKTGNALIESIARGENVLVRNGRLTLLRQDAPSLDGAGALRQEEFTGRIEKASLEQSGPCRAVVKIEGKHANAQRAWLPFIVRLYFYSGSAAVRIMHTFIFDGDERKDFIRGLGVAFSVPMSGELHNRFVRFAGESGGVFGEAVRGLSGLRRPPGAAVVNAQIAGQPVPAAQLPQNVRSLMDLIPAFGDYSLSQPNAGAFEIRKRTQPGQSWLFVAQGGRSAGLGYVGSENGGAAFAMRDFWQKHPTQLDVRGAVGEQAEVTMWLWSPDVPAMDLRYYHDGMGQTTYPRQLQGLDITYEDYEPGFDTPMGVARTTELMLWALPGTPDTARVPALARAAAQPALLAANPEYYQAVGIFGPSLWSVVDRSTPARAALEGQNDFYLDYYMKQVEQRRWYGFWNYGDVMHTYDNNRHVWRYDVGGFAWDNSELSTDLWLWYSFLRSGRADVFRLAEAMTRHTGEVDVHHLGKFAGLGSRHNVMHWGDSAKQLRISTAANRRFYYYLTADERTGDLMRELLDADRKLVEIDATRKVAGQRDTRYPARLSFGTDWCSLAAAWLTEWERTRDTQWRDKLLMGLESIGAMQKGWFASGGGYDPATGKIFDTAGNRASASHLNAVFGAVEINAELIDLLDVAAYQRAWLQYCELYNAGGQEQQRVLGNGLGNLNLAQGHARLTAYAAWKQQNSALAQRAWREFFQGGAGIARQLQALESRKIEPPLVLYPMDEAQWVSTNAVAQWGLAMIQCLALTGDSLPPQGIS